MTNWVYVLKDDEDDSIYVGETTRLYRRWYEHQTGRGGVNTRDSNFNRLIGLYKVSNNTAFLSYKDSFMNNSFQTECEEWDFDVDKPDALEIEKHITQRYIYEYKDQPIICVRGGPYTTEDKYERFRNNLTGLLIDRPLCKCGYPCEVKIKNDKTKVYFVCPIPSWDEFYDGLDLDEPCNFWQEFKEYRISRDIYITNRTKEYCEYNRKSQDIRQIFADTIETGPVV
jgi:predicted GIY-YIG superfamily endonuclease